MFLLYSIENSEHINKRIDLYALFKFDGYLYLSFLRQNRKKNKQEVSDNQSFIIQKCMGMNRILCTYRLFAVGFFFACHSIYENMVNL